MRTVSAVYWQVRDVIDRNVARAAGRLRATA